MNWKDMIRKQTNQRVQAMSNIFAGEGQALGKSMQSLSQIGLDAKIGKDFVRLMGADTDKVVSLLEAHSSAIQQFTSALKKLPKSVPSVGGAIMPNQAEGTPIAQKNS